MKKSKISSRNLNFVVQDLCRLDTSVKKSMQVDGFESKVNSTIKKSKLNSNQSSVINHLIEKQQ